jgi:hypothetical protein
MRVHTQRHDIVDIKHFRYCARHYGMLVALQQELPNLLLEIQGSPQRAFIAIHQLDFENQSAVIALNPNDTTVA